MLKQIDSKFVFYTLLPVIFVLFRVSGNALAATTDFDHFATGFPLSGQHATVNCEACHVKGIFKGTPKTCNGCHNGQIAPGKHARHILSDETCDNCHTSFSWDNAAMDHNSVLGSCSTCHNGAQATGKPANHVITAAECDSCHGTITWQQAFFNHDTVTGRCDTCHNGSTATGKHNSHVLTTLDCGECHNTRSWATGGFNHQGIDGKRCDSCHNGSTATGKHAKHVLTSEDCGACHNTTTWSGARFDHTNITAACSTCHINDKPNSHFVTANECNACHNTINWRTVVFAHTSSTFPGNHKTTVKCIDCHPGNMDIAQWTSPAFKPDCAGCHESSYKPGPHKKTETPVTILYTVAELRDCTGACHIYTDDTFTVIKKQRNTKHMTNKGW